MSSITFRITSIQYIPLWHWSMLGKYLLIDMQNCFLFHIFIMNLKIYMFTFFIAIFSLNTIICVEWIAKKKLHNIIALKFFQNLSSIHIVKSLKMAIVKNCKMKLGCYYHSTSPNSTKPYVFLFCNNLWSANHRRLLQHKIVYLDFWSI